MGSDLDVTKFFLVGLAKVMPTSKSSGAVYAPAQEDSFDLGWLTPNSKLMKKKKTSLLQMVLSKKALCSLPSTAEGK